MGEFDDLIPAKANAPATVQVAGAFDDLIPKRGGEFDDLVPKRDIPVMSAAPAPSKASQVMRWMRRGLTPLIGPSEEERWHEAIGVDAKGNPIYKPAGGKVEQEGLFPALSHPMVPIPRAPSEDLGPLNAGNAPMIAGAAAYNKLADLAEFMESPLGLATGGIGKLASMKSVAAPGVNRLMAGAYAADMARHVPELARQAGEASVTGSPQEQIEADLGLAGNVALAGAAGGHALAPGQAPSSKNQAPSKARVVSEFGGVVDLQAAKAVQTSERAAAAAPVPEKAETLAAQLGWVATGKRAALLVTPGETAPEMPKESGLQKHETPAGVFIYDPTKVLPTELDEAVRNNAIGEVLDYGIAAKPAAGTEAGVVVVRGPDGTEKQAVATDAAHAPAVVAAAAAVAGRDDSVGLETAEQVIQGRRAAGPSRILSEQLGKMVDAREQIPAGLVEEFNKAAAVPYALPAGYAREGDFYKYTKPAPTLTEEQRQAREAVEAMASLRQQKAVASGDPDWSVDESEPGSPPAAAPGRTARSNEPGGVWMGDLSEEQPPDILDVVGDSFRRGVKISSKEDYGDYLARARGRAKELLSATKGEPADQVLKALHESGQYGRIETEDQLLEAMVGAGEARLARRGRVDRIEAWLNRAIEATKPGTGWTGRASMGLAAVPVWLAQETAHGALQVVKAAYTATRDLGQAIATAVEHLRGMNIPGFNGEELRAWLSGQVGERETGQKLAASDEVSDPVKAAVSEYLYQKRSNATDEELAKGIVATMGIDGAEQALRDPPLEMAGATRSKLLGAVTRTLAEMERQARTAGDTQLAGRLVQRQAVLWDDMLPWISELAQSLQGLNNVADMSPDAYVAKTKRDIEKAGREKLDQKRAEIDQAQTAIEQGRQDGLEQVRQDPEVNAAARKAVDAGIEEDVETKKAVVMDLAGPWASVPAILNHARELVRARAAELLKADRRPEALKQPREYLRQILDDLAKRAASIFAAHIQGADPAVPLVEKYMKRLGLTREKAVAMATAMAKEWEAQLQAARAALPKRIAQARATQERNTGAQLNSPTSATDAAIRRQLAEMNLKLGQVLKLEAGRQDGVGRHVAERIVQASGLSGEAADTLRTVLQNRWDALVTAAQRQALKALEARSGVKVGREVRSAFDQASHLEKLGALTGRNFLELVKQSLKLKQLTAEDAARLRELVQKAHAMPEGFMRNAAAADVLGLTERLKGNVRPADVAMGIFYSNILSGLTTPAKIVLENTNLMVGQTIAALLGRPRNLLHPAQFASDLVAGYKRGLAKGGLQAVDTMRTGKVTGVYKDARVPSVMELKPFGERMDVVNFWKWFGRVISTAHETTFKPAWEVKQTIIARDMGRREGLTGRALDQRVADLLANTQEHWEAARGQALSELQAAGAVDRLTLARRTREIIENRREQNMPGSTEVARDFALRTIYLNEPYGLMGLFANAVRTVLKVARQKYPFLGTGAKSQIPFTTVVANILNEKFNWTPIGLARAIQSHRTGELYGRRITDPAERGELYGKAIAGTIVMSAMWQLFGDQIHGNGPSEPNKRKQLQAAGWVPHSVQIGDRYYSYMNTPAALGLAFIGNIKDWHRYGHGDEADGTTRAAFAGKALANTIVSQGMLDSLRRIFEALGTESTTEGAQKLQKLVARTAASFAVPNLVQQVDRIFDPTVYDTTGMEALVKAQIPFVRRDNKPVLTVLGDNVEVGPFHYWAGKVTDDPLLRTLAERKLWVPEPSRQQVVGKGEEARALTPDEFYDWVARSGVAIRKRLTSELHELRSGNAQEAQKLIDGIVAEERRAAKEKYQ